MSDALLAEKLGSDAVYVGEHHFCFASGNSSPLLWLTQLAAQTERIRLGTSVICAPFHNPLRLAEDIAAVDIVSKGRFDLGIGVGSQWEEFQTFGIDPKERFGRTWEIIDIIERCLHGTEETFDWDGKYYHFPGMLDHATSPDAHTDLVGWIRSAKCREGSQTSLSLDCLRRHRYL